MSCFVFLADTHVGGREGFRQQPRDCERLNALCGLLRNWLDGHGPVDGILHGGDLLDRVHPALLEEAREQFVFDAPLHLCVGNHDLTEVGAASFWESAAPDLVGDGELCYTVRRPDCRIHVVPNHWEDRDYVWTDCQAPRFSEAQLDWLEHELALSPDLPHILVTHSPAIGIPSAQTGLPTILHPVPPSFSNRLLKLSSDYPQLRLVLGGHNHANTHATAGKCHFVTVSSFVETPFEFKMIEVAPGRLTMSTHSLWRGVHWQCGYDWDHTYVQGRVCDRAFIDEREPDRERE